MWRVFLGGGVKDPVLKEVPAGGVVVVVVLVLLLVGVLLDFGALVKRADMSLMSRGCCLGGEEEEGGQHSTGP